jgi:hypothetical protein
MQWTYVDEMTKGLCIEFILTMSIQHIIPMIVFKVFLWLFQTHHITLNTWEENFVLHMFITPHNVNWFFTRAKNSCDGSSWWLGKSSGIYSIKTNFTSTLYIPCFIWAPWYICFPSSPKITALPTICVLFIRNIKSLTPNYKTWN